MHWEWLLFLLVFLLFNDWPWLVALVALGALLSWGHWTAGPGWLLFEVALAFVLEVGLAVLRPRKKIGRRTTGLALEGAALGGFVMLWGALPGLVLWQGALGFDALARMHTVVITAGRRFLLRGIRLGFGIVFVICYGLRVGM